MNYRSGWKRLFFFCRVFALKAQDRAIRAEENLRYFVLTGQLLDPRLGIRQIIALRFAPDDEFVGLAKRAASEQLTEDAIKRYDLRSRRSAYWAEIKASEYGKAVSGMIVADSHVVFDTDKSGLVCLKPRK